MLLSHFSFCFCKLNCLFHMSVFLIAFQCNQTDAKLDVLQINGKVLVTKSKLAWAESQVTVTSFKEATLANIGLSQQSLSLSEGLTAHYGTSL